jgi:hypothetical protein
LGTGRPDTSFGYQIPMSLSGDMWDIIPDNYKFGILRHQCSSCADDWMPEVSEDFEIPKALLKTLITTGFFMQWPMSMIERGLRSYPKMYKMISIGDMANVVSKLRGYREMQCDELGWFLAFFQDAVRECDPFETDDIADLFDQMLKSPADNICEEIRSQILDIVLVIAIKNPLAVFRFQFVVPIFWDILGDFGAFCDRICALQFFRTLMPDVLREIIPDNGIYLISQSFIDMDLGHDDEFLGLIATILLLWKEHPVGNVDALIYYLDSLEFRDSIDLILGFALA